MGFRFKNKDGIKYEVLIKPIYSKNDIGFCDNPETKNPKIVIKDSVIGSQTELRVIIEECVHAQWYNLPEKEVRPFAKTLAKLLKKMGWVKKLD